MKVVINRCYGGFSLFPAGVSRYAELKGKKAYFFTMDDQKTPIENPEGLFWTAFSVPNPKEVLGEEDFYNRSQAERKAYNKKYAEIELTSSPEDRADPDLIKVVEELGKKANGACANLQIVEIPDGVEWVVEEYDGNEHIAESHRTWG